MRRRIVVATLAAGLIIGSLVGGVGGLSGAASADPCTLLDVHDLLGSINLCLIPGTTDICILGDIDLGTLGHICVIGGIDGDGGGDDGDDDGDNGEECEENNGDDEGDNGEECEDEGDDDGGDNGDDEGDDDGNTHHEESAAHEGPRGHGNDH